MRPKNFFNYLLISVTLLASSKVFSATTKFINLSKNPMYVAATAYIQPTNEVADGESKLAYVPTPYYKVTGWYTIKPGKAADITGNYFYIEQNGRQLFENSRPKSVKQLYVSRTSAFEYTYYNGKFRTENLSKDRQFLKFITTGKFFIYGSDYRIVQEKINFKFRGQDKLNRRNIRFPQKLINWGITHTSKSAHSIYKSLSRDRKELKFSAYVSTYKSDLFTTRGGYVHFTGFVEYIVPRF